MLSSCWHLIPFTVTIPPEKRDGKLTEKLLKESDGILAWAIERELFEMSETRAPRQIRITTSKGT